MGKRKHSKIGKENRVDHDDEEKIRVANVAPQASQVSASKKKRKNKKKKKTSHGAASSSTIPKVKSEMAEKWKQVVSLQDTLRLILGFIPEYLLERTMRFVNRDFYRASSFLYYLKTCLKVSEFDGDESMVENWKQFKNLKRIELKFEEYFVEDFDASCMTDLGVETCIIYTTYPIFSQPIIGTKWAETLRHLDIGIKHEHFHLLFDLNLLSLKVEFCNFTRNDETLKIGNEEKPLFKSLTNFHYSSTLFTNITEFINRLINLKKLRNDEDVFPKELKLPNIKKYSCAHGMKGIEKAFPKLESLKNSAFHSTPDLLHGLSLKTLKVLSLSMETYSLNIILDEIAKLPLLEKVSMFMIPTMPVKCDREPTNSLPYLKQITIMGASNFLESPILPITYFRNCVNVEKISFNDHEHHMKVSLDDFSTFPKLKSLQLVCNTVSDWKNPVSTLEKISITTEKECDVTLLGLDKLKVIDLVSVSTKRIIEYFTHHTPRNSIRKLKISGKDILNYPFPPNLESLKISKLKLKEINDDFKEIFKKQTNLKKLVIEEAKLDMLSVLEALTCLVHNVEKIFIAGKSLPIYSESKYITKLLKVLSIYGEKRVLLELEDFEDAFSHQSAGYLISQIESRFTTISFN